MLMKILIVEDETFNLMVLEEMIKIFYPDIEIIKAENGQLAYELKLIHTYPTNHLLQPMHSS